MFKQILLAIDGSECSNAAIEKAIAVAKAFGSTITPVYVIDPYPFTGAGVDFSYGQDQFLAAAQDDAQATIDAAKVIFDAAGLSMEPRVVQAHATWHGILDTAHKTGADLIVMGSHGRRGLEKLVLGSVAQSLLAHTDITTMVVRLPPKGP